MTDVVQLTISLWGSYAPQQRQICGQITYENGEYLMFRELENDDKPPRRIEKKNITKIDHVQPPNTAIIEGS